MKKLVVMLVVAMMANVASVSAKDMFPKKNYVKVNQELSMLLNPDSAVGLLEESQVVKVKILVTETGSIVVLSADTDNESLDYYIKESLNYKKFATNELTPGAQYEFAVNFKS
ncbi:hypothetical protein [Flavobacterium sp. 7A]|uniref:hypothetical protein n=1 Tax=Flavobacterium sp. 7A TaxID=2940571 RepID=UPI002226EFBF|nr:hypothetical protein [Flavobacterium sp. 7A]MCW2119887.1 putative Fe-S center protein [Flavobacterium sp. 7A]